ncbi:MAG: PKD domain-containing protein [Methanobacteriota archaeon]|nr:MAG: PKD domain-containing protein [Euryarchaeota archaeon]
MSKLSASLFALVVVLSTLVVPMGDAEGDTIGTNTIYVPVTSSGSPVSAGITVTLTNVHTGEVLPAEYSSSMKLYIVNNAPSGYYRVDVIDVINPDTQPQYTDKYWNSIGERDFSFTGLTSYTVTPQIALDAFPSKQWEWNVTVRDAGTNTKIEDAEVAFYDLSQNEIVSRDMTDSQGIAVVDMFNSDVEQDFALIVTKDNYETYVEPTTIVADNVTTVLLTKSVRFYGFVRDYDGPASNVIAYMLSADADQPWVKRVLKSEEGTYFTFDAYKGMFTLCVDADGASAEIISVDLTSYDSGDLVDVSTLLGDEMVLANQTQTMNTIDMVYGADYNSFTLTETSEWNFDDAFPGIDYNDIGSLRMQIDLNSGDPDGALDSGEIADFVSTIQKFGPRHVTSSRLLVVNDTLCTAGALPPISLTLTAGSIDNKTSIPYSYTCDYTSIEEIDVDAPTYTATLYAAYDTPSFNRTFTVSLPEDYELIDNSSGDPGSHVSVTGFETFTIDPGMEAGGPEPVSLAFGLSETPSAGAGMEIEQGLVYAVTDDGGNVTKYIVRVGSEVNFSAMDSYDPNGNPMTYTWDFDDFTAPVTTTNVTIGHTYDNASASRTVNLTVTDAVGIQNWTEIEVLCDDLDPVPVISIKDRTVNETTDMLELNQGEMMLLNATYSTDDAVTADDSLGVIDFFEFSYGDGNESERISWTADDKNVSHAFADSGTYEVVLNVTDVTGHWKNTTLLVKVNDSDAPVVSFTVKNATYGTSLIENATIVFDANATKDNLDALEDMHFSWYFADGLGAESWLNGTGLVNVTHVFRKVGTFSVELNVTDLSNNSGLIKRSVKIDPSPRPNVMIDGPIEFNPAEFTEGKAGTISVNLTNKGSVIATGIVVTFYIVDEDSETLIGTVTTLLNGTAMVTELEVGGKARAEFKWTPGSKGTYKIKVNVTSTNQLMPDSKTTRADEDLVVKEAPWKKAALWGGIAAVIVLVPLLLYLRGRWSRRERKGPRRDRDRLAKRERREKDKLEKKERRAREKEKAKETKGSDK